MQFSHPPRNITGGSPQDAMRMNVDHTNSEEEPLESGLQSNRSLSKSEANSESLDSKDYNQFGNWEKNAFNNNNK